GWRWLWADDLLYANVSAELRNQPHYLNPSLWTTEVVNRVLSTSIYNVSPRVWLLRLHTRAFLQLRDYDLTKGLAQLGGTSGLRGFPSGAFSGSDSYLVNFELRTKPIALYTVYVGLAAFYDGGSAFSLNFGQEAAEVS